MKSCWLKYFKSVTKEIIIKGAKIKSIKDIDFKRMPKMSMTYDEHESLIANHNVSDFNEINFTFVEYEDDNIPDTCILGLFDLIYNNWEYIINRTEGLNNSLSSLFKRKTNKNIVPYKNLRVGNKIKLFENGLILLSREKRFKIALSRWISSTIRQDSLDSILDCCSSLEAILNFSDERRLRLSLSVYHLLDKKKKESMNYVYKMYEKRSLFIHGVKIPEVTKEEVKKDINVVAKVLLQIIKQKNIPKSDDINKKLLDYYK
jgi:hypothetical protein